MTPVRVLHVVHGLGSGVEAAMSDYVTATPQYEHHLYYSADPSCGIGRSASFVTSRRADGGRSAYVRGLRARVAHLRPDVVHAHSSLGGAACRLALSKRTCRIVYTPHCFGFERRDLPQPVRQTLRVAEFLLAGRTSVLAACSPHEARLAERFPVRVDYVPNVASVPADLARARRTSRGGELRVVCSGRVAPQKDPALLAAIASAAGPGVSFEWVGGGDDTLVRELTDAGVHVTGWVSRDRAIERLAAADVYVHTAQWESAPLSVLEAAALGVPVLVRDTPALRALGCAPLWSTPAEVVQLLRDPVALEAARQAAAALDARHTRAAQADALARVYGAPGAPVARALRDAG